MRRLLPRPWANDPLLGNQQVGLLLWAGVVGALGAAIAIALRGVGDHIQSLLWAGRDDIWHLVAASEPWWRRLALPAIGGVVAGLILVVGLRLAGRGRGWGILEAVALRDGVLRMRPALVKSLSSLVTTSTGGSVGREGPIILMAATVASKVGCAVGMRTQRLRILTACGVAAGMAGTYNAPIGAALFAMEIILGNFAMEVLGPLVFSSVIATLVTRAFAGSEPIFHVPAFELVSAWEVIPYLILGIVGGALASVFLVTLRTASRLSAALPLTRPVAMGVVGVLLGVVVLAYPEICGPGRGLDAVLIDSSIVWRFAGILLVAKMLLTSLTVGTGAVGGVFTPSLFVGAAAGVSFGSLVHAVAPTVTAGPGAYALVGMGCLLAGMTQAPLMAIIMIFELSLNYSIVLPLMLSCAAASLVARALSETSVYTEALSRQDAALAVPEAQVMTSLTVGEIMRSGAVSVPPDLPLPDVLQRFLSTRVNHIYVVSPAGVFLGAISLHDLKETLTQTEDVSFILALDLIRPFEFTVPDEHLDRVMERFWRQACERIPVVDRAEGGRLLGTVSKRDILGVYTLEVLHRKTLVTRFLGVDEELHDESTYVELPESHRVDGVALPATLAGLSVRDARLRERFGVTVLMIRRLHQGGETSLVPGPDTTFAHGDRLVVFGPHAGLESLRRM
ncbi:MAG: ClcB-like voltage-gated chloride channel protein [Acidobacteriota bacterium]